MYRWSAGAVHRSPHPDPMAPSMLRTACSLLATALAAPACGKPTPAATAPGEAVAKTVARDRADASLIPREVLFGNPERAAPRISPDGTQLSFLAPVRGVLNVWVGPVDDLDAAVPVTNDTHRGILDAFWSEGGDRILCLQDRDGDENWQLYAVDPATRQTKALTPLEDVQAWPMKTSRTQPHAMLVGLNDRDARYHDVYRIDILTGERTLVLRNDEGFAGFVADDDLDIRVAIKTLPDGGTEYLLRETKSKRPKWRSLMVLSQEDALASGIYGIDHAGRVLYMGDSRGRETAALVAYDLRTKSSRVLAQDPMVDASDWITDPETGRPLAVAFTHLRSRWEAIDEAVTADLEALRSQLHGDDFTVVSQTHDGSQWVVQQIDDDGPRRFLRYDRTTRRAAPLLVDRPALEGRPLVEMHPLVITSRDGLPLVSYLSLPRGSDPDGDGRPQAPVPMVLYVHGGPWTRDAWGYDPYHQWLANRGYAVLSVNYRGSTGFTKSFVNAGDFEWAGKMHDDLVDAVAWAVEEGVARPDEVAIMGGSYGGYATLVGLTFTPELFACGVDVVGPSNLVTLLQTVPPYWESAKALFATRVGDIESEEGRALLLERSPLTRVSAIIKPLLIGQGANDPRVKQAESDQIVDAMTERGIPVTYVLYPDEGHGFVRPENRISFNAVTEAFLSTCLGGAFQPLGDDFEGSSITIPVGAEHIPGLLGHVPGGGG
jgi:dipeptidyl aminopeptidase/acylaminoacyl peptidase